MNSGNSAACLFHVSEESNLCVFQPRRLEGGSVNDPVVWAIDEPHLVNYLLPRDCPRVTFAPGVQTSETDLARFFPAGLRRVIAIEAEWLSRAMDVVLYVYNMPAQTFELFDAGAGYWLSREPVAPERGTEMHSPIREISRRGAEVRVLDSLWALHEAVADSTLEFSMIRMRNAKR
ncbi:MAG TPA: hypothetical protein VEV41_22845 [Terriglobales bacterium]|nr:hypothetical protein [Terriglobales bacterium]HYL65468.1 hypothetical protein [Candidatus Methylomirabilis sp.]